MRYRALFLAVLLALCLALTLVVSIAAAQPDASGLALTRLEWLPETVHANEEIVFAVSYAKTADLNQIPEIRLQVTTNQVTETVDGDDIATEFCSKTEPIPDAVQLPVNESNTHRFAPCFIPNPGEYTVSASLLVGGEPTGDPLTAALSVGPAQTALPGEFGRLFAGLGMFAAVMVIVALGTEVLIDSLKVLLGMKSKVTTMEAVAQMEKLLPGQLATLGVSAQTQEEFKELSQSLNKTLATIYKPLEQLAAVKTALQQGQLGTAYVALEALETALRANQTAQLPLLREQAKTAINNDLQKIVDRLGLPAALKEEVVRLAAEQIDAVTPDQVDELFTRVVATLNRPDWVSHVTDEWLKGQRDTWLKAGRSEIVARFDRHVKPALESLALDPHTLTAVQNRLETALTSLDVKATIATNTFLDSLENLLNGVEARRFAMQSPLRKLWRRLRTAKLGALYLSLLAALPMILILIIGRFFTCLRFELLCANWFGQWLPLIYYLIAFVITWLILLLFSWQGHRNLLQNNTRPTIRQTSNNYWSWLRNQGKDKRTMLELVESYANQLRGQPVVDPDTFTQPPTLWEVLFNRRGESGRLTPENVASIILHRSDQQRDEESSRQRWLRVISVFVGLALAYILQIDAAQLLNAAVPGVSGLINAIFNFSGEQLHAYWPHFPADLSFTAGMILTGLAASAGSAFWHDQLERLQAAKKGTEAAANILKQAQDVVDTRR